MKIVVFSDSHGEGEGMEDVLRFAEPDAEYVLHLGDGAREFERLADYFPRMGFIGVYGNCDYAPGCMTEPSLYTRTLNVGGVCLYLCHGHRLAVRSGHEALLAAAAREQADIALYGHTHMASKRLITYNPQTLVEEENGRALLLLNPGSISHPRGGELSVRSYAVLQTERGHYTAELRIAP